MESDKPKQKYIDGVLYQLCACGTCGIYFVAGKTTGGKEKRYLKGHYSIGKKQSAETKEKNRQAHLGRPAWNKGKTGIFSDEVLQKIRSARAKQVMKPGWHHSEESKQKNRIAHLGKVSSLEKRKKQSLALAGRKLTDDHRKKISKSKQKEKNPSWKGGIGNLPYPQDWTEDLKYAIRKRDDFSCQMCGCRSSGNGSDSKELSVHHIDYDKDNCDPKNLVTLCQSCHGKTHHNRSHWTKYFRGNLRVVG